MVLAVKKNYNSKKCAFTENCYFHFTIINRRLMYTFLHLRIFPRSL
uniref:Uncharacterized protein n=1 Tax=Anguilla anguilla TaxID=7936 RepID=A0A0E9UGA0_ANGAN